MAGLRRNWFGRRKVGAKEYPSHEAARAACKTYEDPQLAANVAEVTRAYRESLQRSPCDVPLDAIATRRLWIFSRILRDMDGVRVLDLGGAAGEHYFELRAHFGAKALRHWAVVETEAMVNASRSLAEGGLSFHRTPEEAVDLMGGVDVVFSSGTLQCFPDPAKKLGELCGFGARWLAVTRFSVSGDHRVHHVVEESKVRHHGPRTALHTSTATGAASYPLTFIPKADAEAVIAADYEIRCRFAETEAYRNPYKGGMSLVVGYLAEKR